MITEFTTVEQENRNAKQEMNNMYLKLIGDSERLKVLKFLYNHVWLFRIGSVLASMFGFYYDLVLGLGVLGAIAIAMLIAYIIEGIKVYGTKASFAYSTKSDSKWIMYGAIIITVSVMYAAYLFHYKSLTNYKNMMDKKDSSMVYAHKVNQDNAFNKVNLELVGVLNNKTSKDDAIASASIESTNNLLANNGNDYATKAFLDASTITNTGLATTLFLIFIFLETCSLFGVIAGMMLMGSTDKNVKSIVNTQDKLNQMETNVYQAVETQMISNSMVKIEENMKQVSSHPTPPTIGQNNEQKQPNKPQIGFTPIGAYKMPINPYLIATANRLSENESKPKFLPIINKRNPISKGTRTISDDQLKENLKEEEEKVVDLLKFSPKEGEFIKLLWDNGEVKKDDKLIPKRFILEQSFKGRETERELINLYAKLEDMNLILFKNGYRALANMENIITQKVG